MNRGIVLYVEDNAPNAEIVMRRLRHVNIATIIAENGAEGLEFAVQHIPNVILMDFNLPDLDGIEVMRRLKQRDETAKIPVIMLTANANDETRKKALETGCDGYLLKPVNRSELFEIINKYIS